MATAVTAAAAAAPGNLASGPRCMNWLTNEILQGIDEQPALNEILDSMTLQPKEAPVTFKAKFVKIMSAVHPAPAAQTQCHRFIKAFQKDTAGMYDAEITSALASTDQTNFQTFANKLVRLCTQKAQRDADAAATQTNALIAESAVRCR